MRRSKFSKAAATSAPRDDPRSVDPGELQPQQPMRSRRRAKRAGTEEAIVKNAGKSASACLRLYRLLCCAWRNRTSWGPNEPAGRSSCSRRAGKPRGIGSGDGCSDVGCLSRGPGLVVLPCSGLEQLELVLSQLDLGGLGIVPDELLQRGLGPLGLPDLRQGKTDL